MTTITSAGPRSQEFMKASLEATLGEADKLLASPINETTIADAKKIRAILINQDTHDVLSAVKENPKEYESLVSVAERVNKVMTQLENKFGIGSIDVTLPILATVGLGITRFIKNFGPGAYSYTHCFNGICKSGTSTQWVFRSGFWPHPLTVLAVMGLWYCLRSESSPKKDPAPL